MIIDIFVIIIMIIILIFINCGVIQDSRGLLGIAPEHDALPALDCCQALRSPGYHTRSGQAAAAANAVARSWQAKIWTGKQSIGPKTGRASFLALALLW